MPEDGLRLDGFVVMWNEGEREATAYHEAGHAVLLVVIGQPFRYVTLRPRNGMAGQVMTIGYRKPGKWRDEAAVSFAGVIAEDMWWGWRSCRESLIRNAGRTDIRTARDLIRADQMRHLADPDSSWSIRDMAVEAWQYAVLTVVKYSEAVGELAELLLTQATAVTQTQSREIVATCSAMRSVLPHWHCEPIVGSRMIESAVTFAVVLPTPVTANQVDGA